DLVDLRQVAGMGVQIARVRAGDARQRIQPVLSARAHGNLRAGRKKTQRDRAADALAATGDGDAVTAEVEGQLHTATLSSQADRRWRDGIPPRLRRDPLPAEGRLVLPLRNEGRLREMCFSSMLTNRT